MATPADRRLLELLDKWLESLELHLGYVSLDDENYSNIQPWPKHQRPSRWIIELAKQKAVALQTQLNERVGAGDVTFSDALELMAFLSNLLAAEHIARFIPLAHADTERGVSPASGALPPSTDDAAGTREMPKILLTAQPSANVARAGRRTAESKAEPRPAAAPPAQEVPAAKQTQAKPAAPPARTVPTAPTHAKPGLAASGKPPASAPVSAKPAAKAGGPVTSGRAASIDKAPASHGIARERTASTDSASAGRGIQSATVREQVIADAARLVQWGRKWYELAELIAGMAGRPSVTDVRRILKDNKTVIDQKAGRG